MLIYFSFILYNNLSFILCILNNNHCAYNIDGKICISSIFHSCLEQSILYYLTTFYILLDPLISIAIKLYIRQITYSFRNTIIVQFLPGHKMRFK